MQTVLIIVGILFGLPTLYWLSGLFRGIKPKNNRLHGWGAFDQIWGFIDGDNKKFLPYSMPWPFGPVFRPITRTHFVEDGNMGTWTEKSNDGKDIVYHSTERILGMKKAIRKVDEEISRIRKTEIHPYVIRVIMPKSGFTYYLNLTAKIEIQDAMKTLKLDQFLVFIENELIDAVFPWGPLQEMEWITQAKIDPNDKDVVSDIVFDKMIGLKVDDHECIKINGVSLMDYMNAKIAKYGMVIKEFSLEVGFDEKVQKILDARNTQKGEDERRKLEEKISLTREVTRKRELADGEQLITLAEKELDKVTKPGLASLGAMQAESNRAWKKGSTVVVGNSDSNEIATGLLAKIASGSKTNSSNIKTKGGDNEK